MQSYKSARVNVKLLIILALVVVVLVVGAFVGLKVRRNIFAASALKAGNAAYDKEDWKNARKTNGGQFS